LTFSDLQYNYITLPSIVKQNSPIFKVYPDCTLKLVFQAGLYVL